MYTKQTHQNRSTELLNTYKDQTGRVLTLTPEEGTVYRAGTPPSAERLNYMEEGIRINSLHPSHLFAYGAHVNDSRNLENYIPAMTSNAAPSPYTVSGTGKDNTNVWKVFDSDANSYWLPRSYDTLAINYDMIVKLNTPKAFNKFWIRLYTSSVVSLVFYGSNDGTNYTQLSNAIGVSSDSTAVKSNVTFINQTEYLYYKVVIQTSATTYNDNLWVYQANFGFFSQKTQYTVDARGKYTAYDDLSRLFIVATINQAENGVAPEVNVSNLGFQKILGATLYMYGYYELVYRADLAGFYAYRLY